MSDYKQRIIDERDDLKVKLTKLQIFLLSTVSKELVGDEKHWSLLVKQERVMDAYFGILEARIRLL